MRPLKCGCLGELMLFSDLAGISSFREGKRITVHRDPVYGPEILFYSSGSIKQVMSMFYHCSWKKTRTVTMLTYTYHKERSMSGWSHLNTRSLTWKRIIVLALEGRWYHTPSYCFTFTFPLQNNVKFSRFAIFSKQHFS